MMVIPDHPWREDLVVQRSSEDEGAEMSKFTSTNAPVMFPRSSQIFGDAYPISQDDTKFGRFVFSSGEKMLLPAFLLIGKPGKHNKKHSEFPKKTSADFQSCFWDIFCFRLILTKLVLTHWKHVDLLRKDPGPSGWGIQNCESQWVGIEGWRIPDPRANRATRAVGTREWPGRTLYVSQQTRSRTYGTISVCYCF